MSQATTKGKFGLSPEVLAQAQAIVNGGGSTMEIHEQLGVPVHTSKGVYQYCKKHMPPLASPVRRHVEPRESEPAQADMQQSDSRGSYLEEGQLRGTTVVEPIKTPLLAKIILVGGVILSVAFVGVLIFG